MVFGEGGVILTENARSAKNQPELLTDDELGGKLTRYEILVSQRFRNRRDFRLTPPGWVTPPLQNTYEAKFAPFSGLCQNGEMAAPQL